MYARVAQGFRAPSIQGRLLFGNVVSVADSEEILSFEAGIKTSLFNDRARLGFTVYSYTMDDQQLTAVGGATNFNTLINADQTDGMGVEVDFEAYITDNLRVSLGASYNDTEIDDPNLGVQVCGGGCTFTDPVTSPAIPPFVPATVSIDGNRLPQSPEWIFSMMTHFSKPVGSGEFFIFSDIAYRSEVNFFLYEAVEFEGKSLLETRPAHRLRLERRKAAVRRLRTQPDRRDRGGRRHRLQQPDRFRQRTAPHRRGVPDEVLSGSRPGCRNCRKSRRRAGASSPGSSAGGSNGWSCANGACAGGCRGACLPGSVARSSARSDGAPSTC